VKQGFIFKKDKLAGLLWEDENGYSFKYDEDFCLSPAYDLVSTHLVIKNEPEQMSLNLNGRKNKITKTDFAILGSNLQLTEKQISNCYELFIEKFDTMNWWITNFFLPEIQKKRLVN